MTLLRTMFGAASHERNGQKITHTDRLLRLNRKGVLTGVYGGDMQLLMLSL